MVDEVCAIGWLDDVDVRLFEGLDEYLFGEETVMLEVIDGCLLFSRIVFLYRHGVHEEFGVGLVGGLVVHL